MLRVLKRFGIFLAVGGLLGDIVTTLVAPRMLTWFQTPGTGTAMCNCSEVARQTARSFVKAQLIGTLIGALAAVVIGELLYRLWRSRQRRLAPPAAAAAVPPDVDPKPSA
jgi:uncharacterized membrane protein YccC